MPADNSGDLHVCFVVGCGREAFCSSGNAGNQLVCRDHFNLFNGEAFCPLESKVGIRINRVRFPTLDGIPAADWLECKAIEKQMG